MAPVKPDDVIATWGPRIFPAANPITVGDLKCLQAVAAGLTLVQVGELMNVSPRTVRRRLHRICGKLGVKTTIESVVWAARKGLVS